MGRGPHLLRFIGTITSNIGKKLAVAVIADRTGELSNRFRLQVQAYERLARNLVLPDRVYERTQTQSTQA